MTKKILGVLLSIILIATVFPSSFVTANAAKIKGTSVTKLTSSIRLITVKWNKQTSGITGYQIQRAKNSSFTKSKKTVTVTSKNTTSKKLTGLAPSTTYFVRVRTYKKVSGKNQYSGWSKSKSIKTKKATETKSILLKKIKSKTNIQITRTYYADYDGNGTNEMFAIAGKTGYTDLSKKQIWFASTKQVKCLKTINAFIYSAKQVKVNSNQRMFISEIGAGGSGSNTAWYYVASGKAIKQSYSWAWCGLTQMSGAQFYSIGQNFDLTTGKYSGGHTYKRYYFRWNGKRFIEYVGTKISTTKLKSYKNASSYLSQISSLGYKVGTIYKRGNGIININIHKSDGNGSTRNENINLKLKNNKVSVITHSNSGNIIAKSSFGGIYKSSITKEPH